MSEIENKDKLYNDLTNSNDEYFKIITLKDCKSCNNAKKILKEFNLSYTEINADKNKEEHNKKFYDTYGKSYKFFPKIFLNNSNFIGGYKELKKILTNVIISLPTLTEDSGYGIFFLKFLKKYGVIFRKYILIDEKETEYNIYGVKKTGMKLENFRKEYIITKILGENNVGAKIFDCKIINYDEYKKHISNSINCLLEYKKEELLNEKFKNKKIGYIDMEFLKNYRTINTKDIKNKKIKNKILKKIREIHMLGIRHCDIHLQNIMINDNNEIKIIDFSNSLMNQKKVYSENITELIKEEEIENCDKYKNFRDNFKL